MASFMVALSSLIAEEQDNTNKESWLRGIHPQPLCPYAKTKIKFVHYRKVVSLRRDKKKSIHHITACIRFGLFTKALSHIANATSYTRER